VKEHTVIAETQPVPVFGRDGEPCPACGAPLAGDQRYCLHCGARRPEARLEFLDVLDADVRVRGTGGAPTVFVPGAQQAGFAAAPPPRGLNARLQANAGLLALAALLLLTLLIGLLLGHWATGAQRAPAAAAPAPQVIRLEGTAGTAAPATTAAGSGGAAGAGAGAATKGAAATGKSSSATAKAPKGAVSVDKLSSKKAVEQAVKKGEPITTGSGKLPPTDSKPAGNGTSFQQIG
jgi:hypothetical protein